MSRHPGVVVFLCSTYDAGDLPPEVATSGARAYLNKEHLGADTLRKCGVEPAPTVDEAVRDSLAEYGPDARVAVIPKGPYVLPYVA